MKKEDYRGFGGACTAYVTGTDCHAITTDRIVVLCSTPSIHSRFALCYLPNVYTTVEPNPSLVKCCARCNQQQHQIDLTSGLKVHVHMFRALLVIASPPTVPVHKVIIWNYVEF